MIPLLHCRDLCHRPGQSGTWMPACLAMLANLARLIRQKAYGMAVVKLSGGQCYITPVSQPGCGSHLRIAVRMATCFLLGIMLREVHGGLSRPMRALRGGVRRPGPWGAHRARAAADIGCIPAHARPHPLWHPAGGGSLFRRRGPAPGARRAGQCRCVRGRVSQAACL